MSQNEQRNTAPKKGDGGQSRPNQRKKKRRPRADFSNQQKQPAGQTQKPRDERSERNQRAPKKERNSRNRRPRRDLPPVPETYEDVLRDNARLEKEIKLDIDGFSQITLDL